MKPKSKNPALEDFLVELGKKLKPLNCPKDLVEVGVFRTEKTAANCRSNGQGPDYIKAKGTGVAYPKKAVLSWLRKKAVYVGRLSA